MKKALTFALTILMVTSILTACNRPESITENSSSILPNSNYGTQENQTERPPAELPQATGKGIVMASGEGGAGPFITTEHGYYELLQLHEGSQNIVYTEFVSAERQVLCPFDDCAHDNADCPSFVDTSKGQLPGLMYAHDRLFLIAPGSESGRFKPYIDMMEKDGSNRINIAEFEVNQFLGVASPFLADEEHIYFLMDEITENSVGEWNISMCSLNIQNGTLVKLAEYDEQNIFLAGGVDNTMFTKTIIHGPMRMQDIPEELQDTLPKNEIADILQSNTAPYTHQIYSLEPTDIDGKRLVAEWSHNEMFGLIFGDTIYYYVPEGHQVMRENLITSEKSSVKLSDGLPSEYASMVWLSGDTLILELSYYGDTGYREEIWAADFALGTTVEVSLQNNWNKPIQIIGEYEDMFFVVYQYDDNNSPILGYITKDDFYASKANYTAIQDKTGYGHIVI